jgi:hypothetical protein
LRTVTVPVGLKPYVSFHFQSAGTIDDNVVLLGDLRSRRRQRRRRGAPRASARRSAGSPARRPGGAQYAYETDEFWEYADRSARVSTFSSDPSDVIAVKTRGWQDNDLSNFL